MEGRIGGERHMQAVCYRIWDETGEIAVEDRRENGNYLLESKTIVDTGGSR